MEFISRAKYLSMQYLDFLKKFEDNLAEYIKEHGKNPDYVLVSQEEYDIIQNATRTYGYPALPYLEGRTTWMGIPIIITKES